MKNNVIKNGEKEKEKKEKDGSSVAWTSVWCSVVSPCPMHFKVGKGGCYVCSMPICDATVVAFNLHLLGSGCCAP